MNDKEPVEKPTRSQSDDNTCFLCYSNRDRELAFDVRAALTELGVNVRVSDDLQPGTDISTSIIEAILSASFVCVVISDPPISSAVMYEAGLATGSQRPVLVIADQHGAEQLPIHLISAPVIRHKKGSMEFLKENLSLYLERVYPIAARMAVNWNVLPDEEQSEKKPLQFSSERVLIQSIATHLERSGALVFVESQAGPGRVDIMATLPALGDGFNPVIIEVKRRSGNRSADLEQVQQYLGDARARLGLILYADYGQKKPEILASGFRGILLMSVAEFLDWNGDRILQEITRLRNQVVHSA